MNGDDVNLSDEDMFDMGQYNLDRENLMQPNARLHNLFGGERPQDNAEDEDIIDFENGSRMDLSQSEHPANDEEEDDHPFANVFSPQTTLDYIQKQLKMPTPARGISPPKSSSAKPLTPAKQKASPTPAAAAAANKISP